MITLILETMSSRDALGLLIHKVQLKLIEIVLDSFQTGFDKMQSQMFHPMIYEIDLGTRNKY